MRSEREAVSACYLPVDRGSADGLDRYPDPALAGCSSPDAAGAESVAGSPSGLAGRQPRLDDDTSACWWLPDGRGRAARGRRRGCRWRWRLPAATPTLLTTRPRSRPGRSWPGQYPSPTPWAPFTA